MIESRWIIEIFSSQWEGPRYMRKIGYAPYSVAWTDDIYDAKMYKSSESAQKDATKACGFVEEAYSRGWTTYGWDDSGAPTLEHIWTELVKARLSIEE